VAIKGAKSPLAVSPRFPAQRSSAQGESAPKARQICVGDGKLVNIPAPSGAVMGGRIAKGRRGVGRPGRCSDEGALGKCGRVIQGCGWIRTFVLKLIGSGPRKSL